MLQVFTVVCWTAFVYLLLRVWHRFLPVSFDQFLVKLFPPSGP